MFFIVYFVYTSLSLLYSLPSIMFCPLQPNLPKGEKVTLVNKREKENLEKCTRKGLLPPEVISLLNDLIFLTLTLLCPWYFPGFLPPNQGFSLRYVTWSCSWCCLICMSFPGPLCGLEVSLQPLRHDLPCPSRRQGPPRGSPPSRCLLSEDTGLCLF